MFLTKGDDIISKEVKLPPKNEEIKIPRLMVISDTGERLGILKLSDALIKAKEKSLDLVLVAPNGKPPVAKILDFGKLRYELQKKERDSKKKQKRTELKQMKFRPKIDGNDYNTKLKHIVRFLSDGHMVKVTIMFRGREMAFTEKGAEILEKVIVDTDSIAKCISRPKMEGRDMHMTLSPLSELERKKAPKSENEINSDIESDQITE